MWKIIVNHEVKIEALEINTTNSTWTNLVMNVNSISYIESDHKVHQNSFLFKCFNSREKSISMCHHLNVYLFHLNNLEVYSWTDSSGSVKKRKSKSSLILIQIILAIQMLLKLAMSPDVNASLSSSFEKDGSFHQNVHSRWNFYFDQN